MHPLLQQFQEHLKTSFPLLNNRRDQLIAGVSGGVDSMVLLHLFSQLGYAVSAAHVNYHLRGEESNADQRLVTDFCRVLNIPFYVKEAVPDEWKQGNLQDNAREFRYSFFRELSAELVRPPGVKTCWTATAHHQDDQAETLLLHQFRGTGLQGLTGIKPLDTYRKLIRPLLPYTKEELIRYAQENKLAWREDASNATDKYNRNFLRNELIPAAQSRWPELISTLAGNARRLQGVEYLYHIQLKKVLKKLIIVRQELQYADLVKLLLHPSSDQLIFEMLYPLGASAAQCSSWTQILRQEKTPAASLILDKHIILKDRKKMIIHPRNDSGETIFALLENPHSGPLGTRYGTLHYLGIHRRPRAENIPPEELYVRAEALHWPLKLKSPQQGDYFYPLGLNKKKKIARFLIDQKLSLMEKQQTILLCMGDYILWICGRRMDHRFGCEEGSMAHHFRWIRK